MLFYSPIRIQVISRLLAKQATYKAANAFASIHERRTNMIKPDVNEVKIRALLEQWAFTTQSGLRDEILANHSPDVVIYDVLPPMKYEGATAYRKSWDEWQPDTTGNNIFELQELNVTAGADVAFAHGVIHCGGTLTDGKTFEDWVRATFCLRKNDDRWLIEHQHISMPRRQPLKSLI
jgi:ketosteroid isomerase-like protein